MRLNFRETAAVQGSIRSTGRGRDMNKSAAVLLLGCALAATLTLALATPGESIPENVRPESWIALGSDAGFVITRPNAQDAHAGNKEIHGYFVARHDGKWVRIIAEPQGQMIPAR